MPIPFIDALKAMLKRAYGDTDITYITIKIADDLKTTITYRTIDNNNKIIDKQKTFITPRVIWGQFDELKDGYSLDTFRIAIKEYAKTSYWSKDAIARVITELEKIS